MCARIFLYHAIYIVRITLAKTMTMKAKNDELHLMWHHMPKHEDRTRSSSSGQVVLVEMYRQTQTHKKREERRKGETERERAETGREKRKEEKEINWLDCVCNHSCFSPLATGCGVERNFLPHFFRQLFSDHPYNHAHPNCVSFSCP